MHGQIVEEIVDAFRQRDAMHKENHGQTLETITNIISLVKKQQQQIEDLQNTVTDMLLTGK